MIPRLQIQPYYEEEDDQDDLLKITRTRAGYDLKEAVRAIDLHMGQTGTDATGKLLHHTADLIASGGKDLWGRLCYEHAIDHIGLASPRIFHYLRNRFAELDKDAALQTTEAFYGSLLVQKRAGEVALVMQLCPRRPKLKIPIIDTKTHRNETWLRSVLKSPDAAAVRRIYQPSVDARQMYSAGNEIVGAINGGELERALFWIKWLFEEDSLVRKEFKGPGLSTLDRGPPGGKGKNNVGFFLAACIGETYRELAGKGLIAMHEEFQTLLDLYRTADTRLTARRRTEILFLMMQILTEVPRWKLPRAPPLVKDPAALLRIVEHVPLFFKEVMVYPALTKILPKTVSKAKAKKPKGADGSVATDKEAAYEAAMSQFMNRTY
jgi:hypothetical protein